MKNQNSYSLATVFLVSLMTGCAGNLNLAMASKNQTYEMKYKTEQIQTLIPTTDRLLNKKDNKIIGCIYSY
ncbi:MAG: hypothetical protein PHT07_14035 [Paludibacter sp.]|nr:hypothetical protein [Paludibacter sp.]